jgi:hypothetical protein
MEVTMKLLMAIVLAASIALASPAACVPGTEIVSGTFANGSVLTSPLSCAEYGVTFENFSVTVISNPDFSGNWTLSIGPSTGSTSNSGMLEFDFTELNPGDEFYLSYGMSFAGGAPLPGEELTLEAGPLTEVTEHICAESGNPCAVPLYSQDDEGGSTALLPSASEDSVLLDVIDGNRLYQTVFTPEPESFALAGCGVFGIGLAGFFRKRGRATRRFRPKNRGRALLKPAPKLLASAPSR